MHKRTIEINTWDYRELSGKLDKASDFLVVVRDLLKMAVGATDEHIGTVEDAKDKIDCILGNFDMPEVMQDLQERELREDA